MARFLIKVLGMKGKRHMIRESKALEAMRVMGL